MECWCVKYHSYQLGTKELNYCECSCHSGRPQNADDTLRRIDADLRTVSEHPVVSMGGYQPGPRAGMLAYIARRWGPQTPDEYIDENPERWYQE